MNQTCFVDWFWNVAWMLEEGQFNLGDLPHLAFEIDVEIVGGHDDRWYVYSVEQIDEDGTGQYVVPMKWIPRD